MFMEPERPKCKKSIKVRPITLRKVYKEEARFSAYTKNPPLPYFHHQAKVTSGSAKATASKNRTKKRNLPKKAQALAGQPSQGTVLQIDKELWKMFAVAYNENSNGRRETQYLPGHGNTNGNTYIQPHLRPLLKDPAPYDALLPLIIKRAPIQSAIHHQSSHKLRMKKVAEADFPGLPRTGIFVPFLKEPPAFLPSANPKEKMGEDVSPSWLQELSKREVVRCNRRTVYDVYEASPFTRNNSDYSTLHIYNPETSAIDSSWDSYPMVCAGKGAPTRFFTNKARYQAELTPYYIPLDEADQTLIFESRFESGNLRRAVQVNDTEYDLFMKTDFNTTGFAQWFYFKFSNTRAHQKYKFNIVNMTKPDFLYNQGMKILVYSTLALMHSNKGWHREGSSIAYYRNQIQRKGTTYYTLTFTLETEYADDEVYVATDYPYTYTDLTQKLKEWCNTKNSSKSRSTILCKTLAGNELPMIVVTNFASKEEEIATRPAIILTARVHPGEANSSYMMEGVIQYLIGNSIEAIKLRNTFVFKIVPMLNPDGVIIGNYRCSLAGQDLNRQWVDPRKHLFPEIFAVKNMMKKTVENRRIALFCDFHGHSRKKNVFIYGCSSVQEADRLKERIFPFLLSKKHSGFSFNDCCFDVQKERESTGRVVVWKEFNVINSYTCEASFCGASSGEYAGIHFNPHIYTEFGGKFCETLLDMINSRKVEEAMKALEGLFPKIPLGMPLLEKNDECDSADDEDTIIKGEV